jgi:hypothetical protein
MHRARLLKQWLRGGERRQGRKDERGHNDDAISNMRDRWHYKREAFDAAQAASGRTCKTASAVTECGCTHGRKPHLQFDSGRVPDYLEAFDFGGMGDHAFHQTKSHGEVGEIGRRRHHHRIGCAVIGERNRSSSGTLRMRGCAAWLQQASDSTCSTEPGSSPLKAMSMPSVMFLTVVTGQRHSEWSNDMARVAPAHA